jgi:hypothetical protein
MLGMGETSKLAPMMDQIRGQVPKLRQNAGIRPACKILDTMTRFGRPDSVKVE